MSAPIEAGARRPRARRGVALILVVMTMVILIVVASGFVAFTAQDLKTADYALESTTAYYMAEAGIDYGIWLIKHNMTVFPYQNVNAGTLGNDLSQFDPLTNTYTTRTLGDIIDLNANATRTPKEHVVVSDLAYRTSSVTGVTTNWYRTPNYCGSFKVTQTVTLSTTPYTLTLTSVGYVRQIPYGTVLNVNSPPSISSTWTIRSQRTLVTTLNLTPTSSFGNANPDMTKDRINLLQFAEKSR